MLSAQPLVRALGGGKAVAQACGVTPQAVSNWVAADRIPSQHHAAIWRLAQAKGVPWTPPGFEGVRLLPVDVPHSDDGSVTSAPAAREYPVKVDDAA